MTRTNFANLTKFFYVLLFLTIQIVYFTSIFKMFVLLFLSILNKLFIFITLIIKEQMRMSLIIQFQQVI